ncbi:hypothetical protein THOA03_100010 [Vibrio owensii]|nr:hypothetical protein THOA03_100010 [Vibrio owensii]
MDALFIYLKLMVTLNHSHFMPIVISNQYSQIDSHQAEINL